MKELNDIMAEFDKDIDKVLKSTDKHTYNLIRSERTRFQAILRCDICGKEHTYKKIDDVQYDKNDPTKAAALANSVAGFEPNYAYVNQLTAEFHKPSTPEKRKLEIQAIVNHEMNNYPKLDYLCNDCAINLQKLFRNALQKYTDRVATGRVEKPLFGMVTNEEKAALTAVLTEKGETNL